jgi:Lrp/AsnC family transcriptional regulator, regulator of ectoine-degradation genes
MLADEIGIDRYFTYIVTKTVKDDSPLPMSLFSGE